jgi:Cyclin, N-terminal domain/Cyclin, C-terminal domain
LPDSSAENIGTSVIMMESKSLSNLQRMAQEERTSRSTPDFQALSEGSALTRVQSQLWRERVAKWCFDVLDYLEESRDVAYVALNFLDRYLAVLSKETVLDLQPFEFEVLAFTSLFLAIRVCGVNKELQIPELLQLSSSGAQPRHILEAGHRMLEKLSWTHRILTPHAFLKEYLGLFVSACKNLIPISREQVASLLDFSSYLAEVSVCDSFFNAVAPSQVALGALVVAMTCDETLASHQGFLASFFRTIQEHTSINIESAHMKDIISRLLDVYNQSHEASVSSPSANNNTNNNNKTSHAHIQGGFSDASAIASSSPHLIVDDDDEEEEFASEAAPIKEGPMLVKALAQGVMAVDELRSISPSSSLELFLGSGIMRMSE